MLIMDFEMFYVQYTFNKNGEWFANNGACRNPTEVCVFDNTYTSVNTKVSYILLSEKEFKSLKSFIIRGFSVRPIPYLVWIYHLRNIIIWL